MTRARQRSGTGDNILEDCYAVGMDDVASRLGQNVRILREGRGLTQAQMSKLAKMPRATWANLESGASNPTLSVLDRVAAAFQVSIEELIAAPRSEARHYPREDLPVKERGGALVRKLLPDPIPGMEIDRIELPPGARMIGVPHTPGTREYLMCESGALTLVAQIITLGFRLPDALVTWAAQHEKRDDVRVIYT